MNLVRGYARRNVPLAEFFRGPGETELAPGEFIESVSFPRPHGRWGSAFFKLGRRSAMAVSVVNAAAWLLLDAAGEITEARVALGAVAPVPVLCVGAARTLIGAAPAAGSEETFRVAAEAALRDISPIDDIRATAEYRTHATRIAVQRILSEAWHQAEKDRP